MASKMKLALCVESLCKRKLSSKDRHSLCETCRVAENAKQCDDSYKGDECAKWSEEAFAASDFVLMDLWTGVSLISEPSFFPFSRLFEVVCREEAASPRGSRS